jgi:hypothetical protein
LETDPVYDEEITHKINTAILLYDRQKDENLFHYDRLIETIETQTPKHIASRLRERLNDIADRTAKGREGKTNAELLAGYAEKEIELASESGYMGKTGKNHKGEVVNEEDRRRNAILTQDAKLRIYRFLHDPKNENITTEQLNAELSEIINPEADPKEVEALKKIRAELEASGLIPGPGVPKEDIIPLEGEGPPSGVTGRPGIPKKGSFFPTEEEEKASGGKGPNYPTKPTSRVAPEVIIPTGGPSSTHLVREVTAYRPGGRSVGLSKIEGPDKDAHGAPILGRTTMEDYKAGRGHYVTVAMDIRSPWQNQYLYSPQFPGVVFRVRDNGSYGNYRTGVNWIDIAFKDPAKATAFKISAPFQVISAARAKQISSARKT